jgi:hypothetical protein
MAIMCSLMNFFLSNSSFAVSINENLLRGIKRLTSSEISHRRAAVAAQVCGFLK